MFQGEARILCSATNDGKSTATARRLTRSIHKTDDATPAKKKTNNKSTRLDLKPVSLGRLVHGVWLLVNNFWPQREREATRKHCATTIVSTSSVQIPWISRTHKSTIMFYLKTPNTLTTIRSEQLTSIPAPQSPVIPAQTRSATHISHVARLALIDWSKQVNMYATHHTRYTNRSHR